MASVVVLLALTAGLSYVLIFHCGRIKRWLQENRYQIPEEVKDPVQEPVLIRVQQV